MSSGSAQPPSYTIGAIQDSTSISTTSSDLPSIEPSTKFEGLDTDLDQGSEVSSISRSQSANPLKRKPRTAWHYDHIPDEDRDTLYISTEGKEEWRYRYCTKTYITSSGTRAPQEHLSKQHQIQRDSPRETQAINQQRSIVQAFREAERHPRKRRRLFERETAESLDGNVVEILWVSVVVAYSLSLRLLTLPSFRAFLQYLNPSCLV